MIVHGPVKTRFPVAVEVPNLKLAYPALGWFWIGFAIVIGVADVEAKVPKSL